MAPTAASTSSTDPADLAAWVVVGRVAGAHGLQGRVRVRLFDVSSDAVDALVSGPQVRIGASEDAASARAYAVVAADPGRSGEARVWLEGIADREAAEALRGQLVLADPRHFAALPEGEYYGYQLVGCRVESSEGAPIGTVREIWPTGAADLLVIDDGRGTEQLIPAAGEMIREVDLEAKRIVVEVVPGLLHETPGRD
jgi:16S rRNA processing protein RimM